MAPKYPLEEFVIYHILVTEHSITESYRNGKQNFAFLQCRTTVDVHNKSNHNVRLDIGIWSTRSSTGIQRSPSVLYSYIYYTSYVAFSPTMACLCRQTSICAFQEVREIRVHESFRCFLRPARSQYRQSHRP
jgi:hypothetical protein